jgi:serine/threonine-protein kinase
MADDQVKHTKNGYSASDADMTVVSGQDITKLSVPPVGRANSLSGIPNSAPPSVFTVADPLIGQCLNGQYLIQAPLGSGGMSVVYKALNQSIDRVVAVKTIKLAMTSDPVILARFEREIKSLGRLNHLNIVTVYDCVVSEQGQPYIVMDYIDGDSLDKVIHDEGAIDQTRVAKLFIQVCAGLEHAHRQGIIHRDLKPANIMIAKNHAGNELVKVVDFGLAKLMEENQRLTSTGQLWGSIPYMSPEQCSTATEGNQIDNRTDIYSLGIAMYEALTGKRPFASENVLEIVAKQLYEDPLPFRESNPNVQILPNLEAVVFTALRKDKKERFQNMKEMKEAIEYAAGPLLSLDQQAHDELMYQKQSAQLKNSSKRTAPKKPASLSVYLQKKKKNELKIPLIAGLTAICTAALVYLAMGGSHRSSVPSTTGVSAPSTTAVSAPSTTAVSAPSPTGDSEPALQTDFRPATGADEVQLSASPSSTGTATATGAVPTSNKPSSGRTIHAKPSEQHIAKHPASAVKPKPVHKQTTYANAFDRLLRERSDEKPKSNGDRVNDLKNLRSDSER